MEIVMEVETWTGSYWECQYYDVTMEEEDLIYSIKRYDVMFIKGIGELQVNSVTLAGSYTTIYCTYMGGYVGGENKFAEAPWA